MRRRFRFHLKKRGDRVTGSAQLGTMGEAGFFAACLVVGAVALGLIVTWIVIPQWRVNRHFAQTTCHVTARPDVVHRTDSETTLWQPTITYTYEVNGKTYTSDKYDLLDTRYAELEKAEALRDRYTLGELYPCWYDPMSPETAVLLRGNPLAYWLLLLPVAFLAIGIGGLGYSIWQFSASRERRAAMAQRAPGKDLFNEDIDSVPFPAIPRDADATNSPGTTLAFRLPIASSAGWQLFATAVGCACWNGLVALFLFLAVRKHLAGDGDWVFPLLLVPFAAAGAWLILNLCRQFWHTSGIGPTRIEISDHPLQPGNQYDLFVAQTGKMKLENLEMTLVCEEEATFRQGTDTIADHQLVAVQPVMSRCDISIGPGQPFEERCVLTVPETAMHSFRSVNNSISWTLTVNAKVANRPDYERNFSVIVVPATNGEDAEQ